MPPRVGELVQREVFTSDDKLRDQPIPKKQYEWDIVWRNVVVLFFIYTLGIYGFFYVTYFRAKLATVVFSSIYAIMAGIGVTSGSHRLWTHRCYKANLPLRIFLATGHSAAFQNSVYEWARDHRVHHKYADTDADPHNATRGLFFSHVGWLMVRKGKEVVEKGKSIYLEDIIRDPVVNFQHKYRFRIFLLLAFVIPTLIPIYIWGEDPWYSFATCCGRYCTVINLIMCINSFAHTYGTKPYDKNIKATDEQPFTKLMMGEGWHNYHHVFPWDYRAAEFGHNGLSTSFIWLMGKIGWATELKTASDELIRKRMLRTGDGTVTPALLKGNSKEKSGERTGVVPNVWGWNDPDMIDCDVEDGMRSSKL